MVASRVLQDSALAYFLAVVRTGSVNKASARLNVAPSAISRQIARLERELGTTLFERRPSGMVPSASGELLAVHVRRAQLDAERVAGEIRALEGLERGMVRLASTEGLAEGFLPHQVHLFRQRYAGIHFDLRIAAAGEVTRLVREGACDIGLTFGHAPEHEIRIEKRVRAPIHVVAAPGHPLADKRSLSLSQLTPYPLALPSPQTSIRRLFDISCSRQGLVLKPVFTSNYATALINFAVEGGGVALFGELAVRHRQDRQRFAIVPLRDEELHARTIEVQTLAGRILPKGVNAFLDQLRLAVD
ncbi:LysR family transcriptional regulator [Aureimonas populi]|uniref:LysR family transcriptional regulator n=1 Tax=Aureimonas populi TaxID=1701758 RepID=A0ABW5CNK7_9HYPH|nr:LysR family transcriptional regulator [Aureimonas populi]